MLLVVDAGAAVAQTASGAALPSEATGMAAGTNGDFYIVDRNEEGGIWRFPVQGTPTLLLDNGTLCNGDLTVDAFGDLICTNFGLFRIDAETGFSSWFSDAEVIFHSITIGPDGSVWSLGTTAGEAVLVHLDSAGNVLTQTPAPTLLNGRDIAFSPAGVLHATRGNALMRQTDDSSFTVAFEHTAPLTSVAFDEAGRIYVAASTRVIQLDSDYDVLQNPFSTEGLTDVRAIAFMRDPDGSMTSRLVAVNFTGERANVGSGSTGVGLQIGPTFGSLTLESVGEDLVGGDRLGRAERVYLDLRGNGNGRFDIGDASAWIEAHD